MLTKSNGRKICSISTIATIVLIALMTQPLTADEVCDDPAQVLDTKSDLFLMHRIFDASASSRRVFSEIHFFDPQDPHLTLGMGHWIRGNISSLFAKFRADEELWKSLIGIWATTLSEKNWAQLRAETGISDRNAQGIASALDHLLCVSSPENGCVKKRMIPWTKRVGERFNSKKHWFNAGWKKVARLQGVAAVQIAHWKSSVLVRGTADAAKRGVSTRGGIATIISARSSGLGSTMFKSGAKNAHASAGGVSRTWSLTEIPAEAMPKSNQELSEFNLLQDWRSVVAWQFYTVKKRRVRSRMKAIWRTFYKATWGPLPRDGSVSAATRVPQHQGCIMDSRPFVFDEKFASDPKNCSKQIPDLPLQEICTSQ